MELHPLYAKCVTVRCCRVMQYDELEYMGWMLSNIERNMSGGRMLFVFQPMDGTGNCDEHLLTLSNVKANQPVNRT